jgi:hypothetical protein
VTAGVPGVGYDRETGRLRLLLGGGGILRVRIGVGGYVVLSFQGTRV